MLTRMLDFLKGKNITCLFTDLAHSGSTEVGRTELEISSLMDTWMLLSNLELNGDHVRTVRVIKSRGMGNSSLSYKFLLSDNGVKISEVFKINTMYSQGNKMKIKSKAEVKGKIWNCALYRGPDPKCLTALTNLKTLCEEHFPGEYAIEVIDLIKNPKLAAGTRYWPFLRLLRSCPADAEDNRRPVEFSKSADRT